MSEKDRTWSPWTIVGWLAIALFVVIYAVELLPHHGRPATLAWIDEHLGKAGLIVVNIVIVLAFLALLVLAYLYLWRKGIFDWGRRRVKPLHEGKDG